MKNALVRACDTSFLHPITLCVAGVVFLGTPHPKTAQDAADVLTRLGNLSSSDFSSIQIPSLKAHAHKVEKLEIRFRSTLKRSLPRLPVVSFHETRPLNGSLVRRTNLQLVSHVTNKDEGRGPL